MRVNKRRDVSVSTITFPSKRSSKIRAPSSWIPIYLHHYKENILVLWKWEMESGGYFIEMYFWDTLMKMN